MTYKELTVTHFPLKDIVRLFAKIRINPSVSWNGTPCWTWNAALSKGSKKKPDNGGYGLFWWKNRNHYVHRITYAWLVAPCPPLYPYSLDHLCRNRACCNPMHLELVTMRENILRGTGRTARLAAQVYCKNSHPLPAPNKNGERICKICFRLYKKMWRAVRSKEPYSESSKARERYRNDSEYRAREVARVRAYRARLKQNPTA